MVDSFEFWVIKVLNAHFRSLSTDRSTAGFDDPPDMPASTAQSLHLPETT